MYIISNHLFVRNNCWDFTNLFTNLSHFVFSTIVFIAYSQVESYWEPSIRSVRDIIDIVRREISRSRITSSRRITQRGKRRVKFSLGNVNAEKKEGETRIEEGMISWVRTMEKLCAGDAAGFNKETARLVRFES